MVVHRAGKNCVTVYIESAEIHAHGWKELGKDEAHSVVTAALGNLGLETALLDQIEAYTGRVGVMLFVQLKEDTEQGALFFSFDSIDALLDATCVSGRAKSSLFWLDGAYILHVDGSGRAFQHLAERLSEYGQIMAYKKGYERFLSEHGKQLIGRNALGRLAVQSAVRHT